MKVTLKNPVKFKGERHQPGAVLDVPASIGERLVADGDAAEGDAKSKAASKSVAGGKPAGSDTLTGGAGGKLTGGDTLPGADGSST